MKELVYETVVDKKIGIVFKNIFKKEIYRKWGKVFESTIDYEGELHRGSEIKFITPDGGELIGVVNNYVEDQLIEFKYKSMTINGEIIPIENGMSETYAFEEIISNTTLVTVVLDMPDDYVEDINKMWEKGIIDLKVTLESI